MATTSQHVENAISLLKEHPDWSDDEHLSTLCLRPALSLSAARVVLARAKSQLALETTRWLFARPKYKKSLPGESSGLFDNVVRALEDLTGS